MNIPNYQQISIRFQTLEAPPPFSHAYEFVLTPRKEKLSVQYRLVYTERETLSEEEILEEGFTPDDDYAWEGTLPAAWQQALTQMLQQTGRLHNSSTPQHAYALGLRIQTGEETVAEGTPDNIEAWEYFLQEMTQAVFESSRKELPLEINYVEKSAGATTLAVAIRPAFSTRELKIEVTEQQRKHTKAPAWKQLKPLLKAIYLPDYDEAQAQDRLPARAGKYIDPGEGRWYELHKSLQNPGKQYDAVGALEKEIKKLL